MPGDILTTMLLEYPCLDTLLSLERVSRSVIAFFAVVENDFRRAGICAE